MSDPLAEAEDLLRSTAGQLADDGDLVMNVVMVFELLEGDGVSTQLRTVATAMPWWTANGLLEAGKTFD